MKKINWNEVNEAVDFDNPVPGAYVAVIKNVEDVEAKEYLKILWDFAEGNYKNSNAETFERAGFWPIALIRSYKVAALPFFKAFKTALETSNPGFVFDENNLSALINKRFGVILGEEEYRKKTGAIGTRLYVAEARSLDAIRKGDFIIPAKKRLAAVEAPPVVPYSGFDSPGFMDALSEADGDLPF